MESGGSSNPNEQLPTQPTPTGLTKPQRPLYRPPVQHMPVTTVTRIMRRALPPQAKISDAAKASIQECVSQFISFVTNEANQRCRNERRKTISTDDILSAMASLGFHPYIEPLTIHMNRYRAQDRGPYAEPFASSPQMDQPPVARAEPPPEMALGGDYHAGFPPEMGGGEGLPGGPEFGPLVEQSK